jgi:hypothetical protein
VSRRKCKRCRGSLSPQQPADLLEVSRLLMSAQGTELYGAAGRASSMLRFVAADIEGVCCICVLNDEHREAAERNATQIEALEMRRIVQDNEIADAGKAALR